MLPSSHGDTEAWKCGTSFPGSQIERVVVLLTLPQCSPQSLGTCPPAFPGPSTAIISEAKILWPCNWVLGCSAGVSPSKVGRMLKKRGLLPQWGQAALLGCMTSFSRSSTAQTRKRQPRVTNLPQIMRLAHGKARLEPGLSGLTLEDDPSRPFKISEGPIYILFPLVLESSFLTERVSRRATLSHPDHRAPLRQNALWGAPNPLAA